MKRIIFITFLVICYTSIANAQQTDIGDSLVATNIGNYEVDTSHKTKGNSGILISTGHFFRDHVDTTYETGYYNFTNKISVSVQVTQHPGSDSDKWLLHEAEDGYRDSDNSDNRLGLLSGSGVKIREIAGNKFIYWGLGGGSYTWISNQKVIEIKYADLQRAKSEPIEVIQAYLQKHPSTIPSTFVFDQAHDIQWLKDEMDRRLWLADKWIAQITTDDPKLYDKLDDVVKHLKVFLNYKEKYFGISDAEKAAGITAKSEQKALNIYLGNKDAESIKTKLSAYKTWWAAHKGDAISLQ